MSTRSNVSIYTTDKVYAYIRQKAVYENNKIITDLVFSPDVYMRLSNGNIIIQWEWIKWYSWNEDVSFILKCLEDIDDMCLKDEKKFNEYFYKVIEICETGEEEIRLNDNINYSNTDDFYTTMDFHYPSTMKDVMNVPLVKIMEKI